ncbi:hypothetical protein SRHO_G00261860 [Serrasalmus rhombeus]
MVCEIEECDGVFLGSIAADGEPWMVDIDIKDRCVSFKIDTGANVTFLLLTLLKEIFSGTDLPVLNYAARPLLGPGWIPLDVVTSLLLKRGEKRLPFGITCAQEHFQNRMATEVTDDLEGIVCHMDDVLVWGRNQEEHDTRLRAVLQRMQKVGITHNLDKCDLSTQEASFLGHVVSDSGISPDPKKT